jgi:hypothetical protein
MELKMTLIEKDLVNTNDEIISIEQAVEKFFNDTAIQSLQIAPYKKGEIFEKDIQIIFVHELITQISKSPHDTSEKIGLAKQVENAFYDMYNILEIQKLYDIQMQIIQAKNKKEENIIKKQLENFFTNTKEKKELTDKFLNYRNIIANKLTRNEVRAKIGLPPLGGEDFLAELLNNANSLQQQDNYMSDIEGYSSFKELLHKK